MWWNSEFWSVQSHIECYTLFGFILHLDSIIVRCVCAEVCNGLMIRLSSSFVYHQMANLVSCSHALVSGPKWKRPASEGGLYRGQPVIICSAVCSVSPHSHAASDCGIIVLKGLLFTALNHVELSHLSFLRVLGLDTIKCCKMLKWHNYHFHHVFSGSGELLSNCRGDAFTFSQIWRPELHLLSSSAYKNPNFCNGQETRHKDMCEFMCLLWYLGLFDAFAHITTSYWLKTNVSFHAGDITAASQKPWLLHTSQQESSCNKRFNRERPEQPEEKESSGLSVSYPVSTSSLPSGPSGFSMCK